MRPGHRENVRRAIDKVGRERLAALIANVHAVRFTNLHGVKTWRLATDRVHTGRRDLNVLAVADQPAKQSLRNRAATNIASANKEDAFHGARRASERVIKVGLNARKVNQSGSAKRVCGLLLLSIFR
jgi:hypothetical protein